MVHWEKIVVQELNCEKGRIVASLSCFVIFWIEYPVLIYVNNKFCNQNLGFDLYHKVLNISRIFTVCTNFIEAVG